VEQRWLRESADISNFMTVLEFSLIVGAGSLVAGFLGALTGLGGGVVLVPMLTLLLGVDVRYAIGASLVSVIATSSGAAAAYVREGISNIRVGMFLEIATTLGALAGATLTTHISSSAISIAFGLVLIASAFLSWKRPARNQRDTKPDPLATKLRLNGSFPEGNGFRNYNVQRVPLGWGLMFGYSSVPNLLQVFGTIGQRHRLFALNQYPDLFDHIGIGESRNVSSVHVVGEGGENATHEFAGAGLRHIRNDVDVRGRAILPIMVSITLLTLSMIS
jgi:hypothetical protein